MDVGLALLIFLSVLGILLVLYALNFRKRVLFMGTEALRAALSRALSGDQGCTEEELRDGAEQLDSRFRRAVMALCALFLLDLTGFFLVYALFPATGALLAMIGVAVFLLAAALSLKFLRDLPLLLLQELRGAKGPGTKPASGDE